LGLGVGGWGLGVWGLGFRVWSLQFGFWCFTHFVFAAHAQAPAWKGMQVGNSQAIIIEAASRIAAQYSQDTHKHRFVLEPAEAPSQPMTHRSTNQLTHRSTNQLSHSQSHYSRASSKSGRGEDEFEEGEGREGEGFVALKAEAEDLELLRSLSRLGVGGGGLGVGICQLLFSSPRSSPLRAQSGTCRSCVCNCARWLPQSSTCLTAWALGIGWRGLRRVAGAAAAAAAWLQASMQCSGCCWCSPVSPCQP